MALWTFLGLTSVATLYFGWHYVVDDIAGLGIGVIAVSFAGIATGHLRPEVPVRWRPAIPNALTLGRIAIVPAVVLLLLGNSGLSTPPPCCSRPRRSRTMLDGRLARRWQVQSVFGTLVDPFADKLLVSGRWSALAAVDRIPVWVVVIIASREIWVTLLRSYAARQRRRDRAPGPLGKAKMVVQVFTLFAVIAFDLTGLALDLPLYAMVAHHDRLRHRDRTARAADADAPVAARATRGSPPRAERSGRGGAAPSPRLDTRPTTRDSAVRLALRSPPGRMLRPYAPTGEPSRDARPATPHSPLGKARARVGAAGC